MNHPVERFPLSGIALDTFLDEAERSIDLQIEAGVAKDIFQTTLRAALSRQPFLADNMAAVSRLNQLWLRAGEPAQALKVVDDDGEQVRQQLPLNEQTQASISLSFWRLGALSRMSPTALQSGVTRTEQYLRTLPLNEVPDKAWAHLASWAEDAGDHDCVRRCATARHTLQTTLPQRAAFRAWDSALLASRLALSWFAQGQIKQAQELVRTAIQSLADAAPEQDIDFNDWLHLGQAVVPIAPHYINALSKHTLARVPADLPMPLRRGMEVKLARLQAQALGRQGNIEAALAMARKGDFDLVDDDQHADPLGASMLEWLMQAGRHDEAATFAFNSAYVNRLCAPQACAMALQQAATSTNPHWALTLAAATLNEATEGICGTEDLPSFFKRYWNRAAELDPQHPALESLHALFMYQHDEAYDPSTVLTLLEATVHRQDQSLITTVVLEALWTLRVQLHGPERAVKLPFPATFSGYRCYATGCLLADFDDNFPNLSAWPTAEFKALSARYYAEGLARFEAFFATGEGASGDANIHTYSMLCNNLGIYRRHHESDARAAIELHQKGLATSPFAEHVNGLMSCEECLEDWSSYVSTADRLWHYSAEYGYSRHAPANYVGVVSWALYKLGRDNEVAIWLQRLEEWWAAQDDQTRSDPETEVDYINALCRVVGNLARCQPEDALAKIDLLLARARSAGQGWALTNLGLAAERARQPERALALYREGEALFLACDPINERDLGIVREAIQDCAQSLKPPRPWWRFWG